MKRLCFMDAILICVIAAADAAYAAATPETLAGFETEIKLAIAGARPAVVRISAYQAPPVVRAIPHGGRPFAGPLSRSIGSGVIVDPRGYVLTNAHVVEHFQDIRVRLWRANSSDIVGQVYDQSAERDLALIRLTARGRYPCASFGRSSAVRTGDFVVAIGNPYGLEQSVSMGVISDRARTLAIGGRTYRDLLQTDAAINQGNSGGPLIDLRGEVVGINTAIYAPKGVFAGVGFAIPADTALSYLEQLLPGRRLGRLASAVEKEAITPGATAPHGPLGRCSRCHTFVAPQKRLAVTVSQTHRVPSAPQSVSAFAAPPLTPKLVLAFAVMAIAIWVIARNR